MKKIWVIYDTKFGNNRILANEIKDQFDSSFEVHIGYVNAINPKKVLESHPFGLIIGGPIRFGNPSFALKRWINKFGKFCKKLKIRPVKVISYCTAFGDSEKGAIIHDLIRSQNIADQIKDGCTALMVEELKGSFKPSEIQHFIEDLQNFF